MVTHVLIDDTVFPVYTGMIPNNAKTWERFGGIPRVYGDDSTPPVKLSPKI